MKTHTAAGAAHDATVLIESGALLPELLIDQGLDDRFLAEQLHPDRFEAACRAAGSEGSRSSLLSPNARTILVRAPTILRRAASSKRPGGLESINARRDRTWWSVRYCHVCVFPVREPEYVSELRSSPIVEGAVSWDSPAFTMASPSAQRTECGSKRSWWARDEL